MSFSEMLVLMLLALIIFGPKKLPQVGKQIGRVLAELKSFTRDFKSQLEVEMEGRLSERKSLRRRHLRANRDSPLADNI